jgi:hypothetical protein
MVNMLGIIKRCMYPSTKRVDISGPEFSPANKIKTNASN